MGDRRGIEALRDVILKDDSLLVRIEETVLRIMKKRGGHPSDQTLAAIDEAVDVVFAECEIFQTVSRAVDRVRAAPRLDKSPSSPQTSLAKPGFSDSEPTKSAQLSRASPKSKTLSPEVGREKGKFSGGKYSPLSEKVGSGEKADSEKDGWSPPPAFQQTVSPDLDKGVKIKTGGGGSPKGLSPARLHQETMRHSPSRSPPKSTPEKGLRPKGSPFGSPGSGLEDDNFEDSFDGGGEGGTMDFTKRYRFSDGSPESRDEAVGMSGTLGRKALSAALRGEDDEDEYEEGVNKVDITDDWLLSRSEGNPDESSLSVVSSNISARSSPASGGGGSASKLRKGRSPCGLAGSNQASPVKRFSPSKSPSLSARHSSPSSHSKTIPATKAEGVLRGYINELSKSYPSPLAGASKSPSRAGTRYGGVRDSISIDSSSPTWSPRSPLASEKERTPQDEVKGKNKGVDQVSEVALSLEGGSSVESGGPATLDGGEEVYEARIATETAEEGEGEGDGPEGSQALSPPAPMDHAPASLDRKFRSTLRGPLDLTAVDVDVDLADDFANNFDQSFEAYDEDGFNSDGGSGGGLSPPNKSESSPSRAQGGRGGRDKGKSGSGSSSSGSGSGSSPGGGGGGEGLETSMGSEGGISATLSEPGYGSDDFEMMDYEADKPNAKRVRFPRQSVVSDVFVIREKYDGEEVQELFYTQEEAVRFSLDYSKETMKAEMAGLTWYDWWLERREEDVIKDEKEESTRREAMMVGDGSDDGSPDWYGQDGYGDEDFQDDFELEEEEEELAEEVASDEDNSNDFDKF